MYPTDFRIRVVRPTLQTLNKHSLEAEDLLIGTALAESSLYNLVQVGSGPALGVYQMEPVTLNDIWVNYLQFRPELKDVVSGFMSNEPSIEEQLIGNLFFATAMTRVHYLRVPDRIPKGPEEQAKYWKRHYNTELGKGTVEHYLEAWERQ